MSKRSRSDSESSSSSSMSGSSVEPATPSISTSKIAASRTNAGYRPPRGFQPVTFSSSLPLLQSKLTGSRGQEIWAVRIPAGISPAQLDGVVIDLPRDGDSFKPLGTITVPQNSNVVDIYHFHASSFSSAKGKGKKAQSSNADSQLIAMAAEGPMEDNKDAGAAAGEDSSELASLQLLVPESDGNKAGKLVMAPVKVDKCLRLSIVSPAETQHAQKVKETSNKFDEKKLPQQPWHLLKGNFKPAGSRNETEATHEPSSQGGNDSQDKKEKKRKVKTEGDRGEEKKSKKSKKE